MCFDRIAKTFGMRKALVGLKVVKEIIHALVECIGHSD